MLVTVVIPAYNCEEYLEEAVESVLCERDGCDLDVVVVEDKSDDDTLDVCVELARRNPSIVRVLRHPGGEHMGIGASRNLGIDNARGDAICFLDGDDYWFPGRLSRAIEIFGERPDVDGVYEAVKPVFESTVPSEEIELHAALKAPPRGLTGKNLLQSVLNGRHWHTNGITLRPRALERAGGFPTEFSIGEDMHLWARLAATCSLVEGRLTEPVAAQRRHGQNTWYPGVRYDTFEKWWDLCCWFQNKCRDEAYRRMALESLIRNVRRVPSRSAAYTQELLQTGSTNSDDAAGESQEEA